MVSVFSLSLSSSDCFLQSDRQAGKVLYLNEETTVIRLMLYTCSKEAYFEVRVYAKERGDWEWCGKQDLGSILTSSTSLTFVERVKYSSLFMI